MGRSRFPFGHDGFLEGERYVVTNLGQRWDDSQECQNVAVRCMLVTIGLLDEAISDFIARLFLSCVENYT